MVSIGGGGLSRPEMGDCGSVVVVSVQEKPCFRCLSICRGCNGGGTTSAGRAGGLSKLVLGVATGVGKAGLLGTCEDEAAKIAAFSRIPR